MATDTKYVNSGGISFMGALFLVFLFLKLAAIGPVATWSWWWVTAPLWGGIALVIAILLGALGIAGVLMFIKKLVK